jgi:4-hydroxybenzoate polyprenyltransferase
MQQTRKEVPRIQQIVAVMWPSFLTAGIATILFFTAFDPEVFVAASGYHPVSRTAGYSIGFFCFWLLTASSCALTCYFQRPCDRINKPENDAGD